MEHKHREIVEAIPRLRRFAYTLTGSPGDADDLVQETIEKALRRISTFKKGGTMQSWLFKIMQNTFIDSIRSQKVKPDHVSFDETEQVLADKVHSGGEDRVFLGQVREAIGALPEPQRLVIAHVFVAGHSYKETAQSLDIPIGTVMSRLNRARKTLQTQLSMSGANHE